MQQSDLLKFNVIMNRLGAAFMRDVDDTLKEIYWQHLNGYDFIRIEKAIDLTINQNKMFPKVAEIIKCLPPVDTSLRIPETTGLTPNERVWVKYQQGFIAYLSAEKLWKKGVTDDRKKRTAMLLDYLRKRQKGYKIPRDRRLRRPKAGVPRIPEDEEISIIEVELHEIR